MRQQKSQRGEGQAGCIVGLIILLAVILVAYKMIPIKIKAADLRQTIVDEARSAGKRPESQIKAQIIAKADKHHLPVTEKEIVITRGNNIINITVDYTVPVQFPGYVYQWHFKHEAENPIF